MKKYIVPLLLILIFLACSEDHIKPYHSVRYLYFSKPEKPDSATFLSFTHYPNETEKSVALEITLAGDLLTEALPFRLAIVEDSTNAESGNFAVDMEQVFRPGQVKDTVYVKLFRSGLKDKEMTLLLRIMPNDHFQPGLLGYTDARIIFNDVATQPLWWDSNIETLFLGKWSALKYETLIKSSGLTDLTGVEYSQIRKICLQMKEYIRQNGITEADGSPMQLPVS